MLGLTWKTVCILGMLVAGGVACALTGNHVEAASLLSAATAGAVFARKEGAA